MVSYTPPRQVSALSPRQIPAELKREADATYTLRFQDAQAVAGRFYVAPKGMELGPLTVSLRKVAAPKAGMKYLAVGPASFGAAAQPLLAARTAGGLQAVFADQEGLFDAFNYGRYGPVGIQKAVRALRPRYLLLLGRTTYDYLNYEGSAMDPLCPTFLVGTTWLGCAPADAPFGDLGQGYPEVAVGRLPVVSAVEVATAVQRILAYEQRVVSDRKGVLLADTKDPAAGDFHAEADELGAVATDVEWQKVYLGGNYATQAAACNATFAGVNAGADVVYYVGHGTASRLGMSAIISASATAGWQSNAMLLIASCNGTMFYMPSVTTYGLAQKLMTQAGGGAPGVIGSTTYTVSALHTEFMKELWKGSQKAGARWGDALLGAQKWAWSRAGGDGQYLDFTKAECILGDPALPVQATGAPVQTSPVQTQTVVGPKEDF